MAIKKTVKKKKLTSEEKEEKSREGDLPPKKIRDKETQQIIGFLIIVGLVFASFIGVYYSVKATKTFEFGGAEWWIEGEAEGWGDVIFYHGRYPVKTSSGKIITNMNLWLRNDPRENNIPADIDFLEQGIAADIIVTFGTNLMACEERTLVTPQISQAFGAGLPWTTVVGAVANKQIAEEQNLLYADCSSVSDENTVILVQQGDKPAVFASDGCYVVQYDECSGAVKASEKLILELIKQLNN